jgi:cytochrome c oxidase assembly protein subunit 11
MTDAALPISDAQRLKRNKHVAYYCIAFIALMVGAAYAAVPFYNMLCKLTGLDGTTQVSSGNVKGIIDREMTVRFDSNIDSSLPWQVTPATPITGKIGSVETITFRAHNTSNKPVTGQAIFNVTPETTGLYFNKIECFCFTEQTLKPGETVDMPVTFFVDPDIAKDHHLDPVRDITLSYTFYAVPSKGS